MTLRKSHDNPAVKSFMKNIWLWEAIRLMRFYTQLMLREKSISYKRGKYSLRIALCEAFLITPADDHHQKASAGFFIND